MIPIPSSNRAWTVRHDSDIYGSIVNSRNLDFSKDGYVQLARKAMVLYSGKTDVNFRRPIVFAATDSLIYLVTTEAIFEINPFGGQLVFSALPGNVDAPDSGIYSDALVYQSELHVSDDDSVCAYDGSSWDRVITGLSDDYPHPLCVSEHQVALAVGDGNLVNLYNTGYSLLTTLVLPKDHIVFCIRWRMDQLYIGTRNISGGSAKVFIWNGAGTGAQQGYSVQADWVYSMCEYQSSIAAITSAGQVLRFNGGGFDELPGASLPVASTPYSWTSNTTDNNIIGKVASRGMAAIGSSLYININGELDNESTVLPGRQLNSMPSGVWVYEPTIGMSHRAGYNYQKKLSLAPSSVGSSVLQFATSHQAQLGDAVIASNVVSLVGVTEGQVYYAVPGGSQALKLALTPKDALEGRTITITGTPAFNDTFDFDTYESVSSTVINNTGPIFALGKERPNLFYGSEVFFAGEVMDGDMENNQIVMSLGMGRNVGRFTTAKILASDIEDTFQQLVSKYTPFILDTQKLVIKYRSEERYGFPTPLRFSDLGLATWVTQESFTVDARYRDFKSVEVGDEIEVVEGAGAGYTAHITDIQVSGDTYTVTLDESFPVTTEQQFDFVADNWERFTTITNEDLSENRSFDKTTLDDVHSKWVQFRVELRGFNMSIEQLLASNDTHRKML